MTMLKMIPKRLVVVRQSQALLEHDAPSSRLISATMLTRGGMVILITQVRSLLRTIDVATGFMERHEARSWMKAAQVVDFAVTVDKLTWRNSTSKQPNRTVWGGWMVCWKQPTEGNRLKVVVSLMYGGDQGENAAQGIYLGACEASKVVQACAPDQVVRHFTVSNEETIHSAIELSTWLMGTHAYALLLSSARYRHLTCIRPKL